MPAPSAGPIASRAVTRVSNSPTWVRPAETGNWYWPQKRVRYDSAGMPYREVLDFGFHICPRDDEACKAPKA